MNWLRIHLIDNCRDWWKLWSMRFLALAFLFDSGGVLWLVGMTPPSVRDLLPPVVFDVVQVALYALAMVSRFVKQPKLEKSNDAAK